jgi:hypothetical protein
VVPTLPELLGPAAVLVVPVTDTSPLVTIQPQPTIEISEGYGLRFTVAKRPLGCPTLNERSSQARRQDRRNIR